MYKSFRQEKHKLNKLWKETTVNEKNINKLETIKIDFRSISEYKREVVFNIVNNVEVDPNVFFYTVEFVNLPEWMIYSAKIEHRLSSENAYDLTNAIIPTASSARENQGDISLGIHQINHFWEIQDESVFLYIFREGNKFIQAVPPFNEFFGVWASQQIPTKLTLNVVFKNPKDYNEIQSREKKIS